MKQGLGLVLAGMVFGGAGCVSPAGPTGNGLEQTLTRLRDVGAAVSVAGAVGEGLFDAPGTGLKIDGEDVQAYEFVDPLAAETAARSVSPGGGIVGTRALQWMAPVRFHRLDRVIVVYAGHSDGLRQRLRRALGDPFAGSAGTGS